MNKAEITIIGAGASGLVAAIAAARSGAGVTILEANERPGRKLLASGNGKCNLTNLHMHEACYRGSAAPLAMRAIERVSSEDILSFFHGLGLSTFDRDGWVYPRTEQSSSVLSLLLLEAEYLGVRIRTCTRANQIRPDGNGFEIEVENWSYQSDAVILACGSPASSVRGASDDAVHFAAELGISFAPFLPALVPLRVRGDFCTAWAGTRIYAGATLLIDQAVVCSDVGTIQLTDYGISGIPIFQLSRYASAVDCHRRKVRVVLDLFPDLAEDALLDLIESIAERAPHRSRAELLIGILPEQLIPILDPDNGTLADLSGRLKAFAVEITGTAAMQHAQIACGGISADELDDTLCCRKIPNLYVTGEAVDVDGICGGYNLQWAFSSGMIAGLAAAKGASTQ